MAITLTIAGTNRTSLLRRAPIAEQPLLIDEQLNMRSTAAFELVSTDGTYRPSVGQVVTITDGGTTIFAGTIHDFSEARLSEGTTPLHHLLNCVDYNQIADRRLVQAETYDSQTAGAIVLDIVTDYLNGEGITSTDIDAGPTITHLVFNYDRVSDALDQLSDLSGFAWWIDYDKKFWFKQRDKIAAPFALTNTSGNYRAMRVERTREDYRNRQWFKGAYDVTATQTDESVTPAPDGVSRTFLTKYPVATITNVKKNGSTSGQTIGVLDVDTGRAWYYLAKQAFITQDAGQTVLSSTATLTLTYEGFYPLVSRVENAPEQVTRAAVEGGSGIYESVRDFDADKADTVIELANALLRRYATMPTKLHFETDTSGLFTGQIMNVNITAHSVTGAYLITRVRRMDIGRGDGALRYEIEALSGEVLP